VKVHLSLFEIFVHANGHGEFIFGNHSLSHKQSYFRNVLPYYSILLISTAVCVTHSNDSNWKLYNALSYIFVDVKLVSLKRPFTSLLWFQINIFSVLRCVSTAAK